MVSERGIEPPTRGLGNRCSIHWATRTLDMTRGNCQTLISTAIVRHVMASSLMRCLVGYAAVLQFPRINVTETPWKTSLWPKFYCFPSSAFSQAENLENPSRGYDKGVVRLLVLNWFNSFTSALFFWAVFAAIFALRAKARAAQIATKHLQNFNAPVFELNQLSTSVLSYQLAKLNERR